MNNYITWVLEAYNDLLLTDYRRQALGCDDGSILECERLKLPFALPKVVTDKEIYGDDNFPLAMTSRQKARDVVLRSFVSDPLQHGGVGPIYKALKTVQAEYGGKNDLTDLISRTLENIFLRAILSDDDKFIRQVVKFLTAEDFRPYVDWQKLMILTGRGDLLFNFQYQPVSIKTQVWWKIAADGGNIIAMKALAQYHSAYGELPKAKHYLTVLAAILPAVSGGHIEGAAAFALQQGVKMLGDIYFSEGHFSEARSLYQLVINSGFRGEIENLTALPDAQEKPIAQAADEHVKPVIFSDSARAQLFEKLRQQKLTGLYTFNSAQGNAVRLLTDDCPITYDLLVSVDNREDALCHVALDQWVSLQDVAKKIVISEQGYLYGRTAALEWLEKGNGEDPLNRGKFEIQAQFKPLDINFLNILLNLAKLQTEAFADFVAALPDSILVSPEELFLVAHFHPALLAVDNCEQIVGAITRGVTPHTILTMNHHFLQTGELSLAPPSAPSIDEAAQEAKAPDVLPSAPPLDALGETPLPSAPPMPYAFAEPSAPPMEYMPAPSAPPAPETAYNPSRLMSPPKKPASEETTTKRSCSIM